MALPVLPEGGGLPLLPLSARPAVKVCGLTRTADVLAAAQAGAWAVGFVLAPSSRRVSVAQAAVLVESLRERYPRDRGPIAVGVFVEADPERTAAAARAARLDAVQFHGDASPSVVARVRELLPGVGVIGVVPVGREAPAGEDVVERVRRLAPYVDVVLLDTCASGRVGGTGVTFPWSRARGIGEEVPFLVAGGIGPDNAVQAVRESGAWGVDASSALESAPGVKDQAAVERLLSAVAALRGGEWT